MTDPTPRDRALAGEVVKVTDERLAEMQRIAIANEGVELYSMHWHWACAINELIAARGEIERLNHELAAYRECEKLGAPLSCPTHGLVSNLASFDNKCPECVRDVGTLDGYEVHCNSHGVVSLTEAEKELAK